MKKEPRYYQREAGNALVKGIMTQGCVPYAKMATGSGKSLVLAMISDWALKRGWRVLQLVPTKELCEQNAREFNGWSDHKAGICCTKLGRFETDKNIVIATTTSFLRKRSTSGRFDLLLVDECHLLSPKDNSMYQRIIRSLKRINPDLRIAGVSATPYRLIGGMLHNDSIEGKATFTHCVYETDIRRLIHEGYLSHVESISGDVDVDLTGVKVNSDYNTEQMGVKFDAIIEDAVQDMKVKFKAYGIKTAFIFASTLDNARKIIDLFDSDEIKLVYGDP
jgi:DNA repair protein RadD